MPELFIVQQNPSLMADEFGYIEFYALTTLEAYQEYSYITKTGIEEDLAVFQAIQAQYGMITLSTGLRVLILPRHFCTQQKRGWDYYKQKSIDEGAIATLQYKKAKILMMSHSDERPNTVETVSLNEMYEKMEVQEFLIFCFQIVVNKRFVMADLCNWDCKVYTLIPDNTEAL